jgi:uncharacterized membrane protein YvbJ
MSTLICPKCNYKTEGNEQFCCKCGAMLAVVPEKAFCSSCGAELKPGTDFCSQCGAKQDAQEDNDLDINLANAFSSKKQFWTAVRKLLYLIGAIIIFISLSYCGSNIGNKLYDSIHGPDRQHRAG